MLVLRRLAFGGHLSQTKHYCLKIILSHFRDFYFYGVWGDQTLTDQVLTVRGLCNGILVRNFSKTGIVEVQKFHRLLTKKRTMVFCHTKEGGLCLYAICHKQALRNSCELLRQRKELQTSSWNLIHDPACLKSSKIMLDSHWLLFSLSREEEDWTRSLRFASVGTQNFYFLVCFYAFITRHLH